MASENPDQLVHLTEQQLLRRDQERLRQIAVDKQKALDSLRQQQNDEIERAGVCRDNSSSPFLVGKNLCILC
jgi:hypothetical protein